MFFNFASNVIEVLVICCVIIWIDLTFNKKYSHYMLGVMFGLINIFVMKDHIMVAGDCFYVFLHITMTMAGFIGGPVTAVIAALISSLYRYTLMVGNGSMGGTTNIIVFACFGIILGKYFRGSKNEKNVLVWFTIGIVMSFIVLSILAFYELVNNGSLIVLKTVAVPFLIITPLTTAILFNFYFRCNEFFNKASILNAIINYSPINLMIFDSNGPILLSENLKQELKAYPFVETLFPLLYPDDTWLNRTKQQQREIVTEDGRHFNTDLSGFQMPNGKKACLAIVNDVTDRKREQETLRRAIDRFSKAFQLGPHMMAILSKSDYKYVDVNRRYLKTRGFEYEDLIGKTPIEIGVSQSNFRKIFEALEEHGTVNNVECTLPTKYGSNVTVILSAENIQIDNQECILFAYNDVTEMKLMQTERVEQLSKLLTLEADLARSNQLIADIINNMPDPFFMLDDQWHFKYVNNRAEELLLRTREELLDHSHWELLPQTRGTNLEMYFQKVKNDGVPMTFDFLSVLHKDRWLQFTVYPFQSGLSVYYRDITEQKLAREKLTKSQDEIISILESMTDCFCACDENLQFTYVNHGAEIVLGKSRDELLGKKVTEVFLVNDITQLNFHEVMHEKLPVTFEVFSKALGNKWLEMSLYPTETGVSCYFRDISNRKLAEEALRQSEEKFSKAFHGGPIMMVLATVEEGKFIDVNEAFCSGIGYTRHEIIGRTTRELNLFYRNEQEAEWRENNIEQGRLDNAEFDFRTKSGEIRKGLCWSHLLYLDELPCHITGFVDITEQKRIQKEMTRLERLNLIGQMAGSIAHEVRNPMTTVRGYLQLLGLKPEYEAKKSTFDLMISELDRANAIITEFLSLTQTKTAALKPQNLNDIINNIYPLLEADTFNQNKQICFIPGEVPILQLNEQEISQLILNLTRNGLEAMLERGSLTIKSYLQNDSVVLAVIDEGCGIPPEQISKLGTPFVTNKDTGTGLGLATCYKIAESHHAKIQVDSSPEGTTFFIIFPIPDLKQNELIA